jgi:hypothetical protein
MYAAKDCCCGNLIRALCCVGSPYNHAPVVDDAVAADINQASADVAIVVTYDDDHALDTTTFDNADIVLIGVCAIIGALRQI